MPKLARLYLDTARLGRMCPGAQLAARDFARLAGEGLSTLYFQKLLRHGFLALDRRSTKSHPGIADWPGIDGLSRLFGALVNLPQSAPVLFASRSASLLRFAGRQLWARCRRILVPDTAWQPYVRILNQERIGAGRTLIPVPIREAVLCGRITADELVAQMAAAYHHHGCDGLFLPAISHDGVRIPFAKLLESIRSRSKLNLAVIDGAQELAHAPIDLATLCCDIYMAGCHKWLGAHQPLGMGILANPHTDRGLQSAHLADCRESQDVDPLLRFMLALQGNPVGDVCETVNLAPLFTAWGALREMDSSPRLQLPGFVIRQQNAYRLAKVARSRGWQALLPHPSLRTGILLLQSMVPSLCQLSPSVLEQAFAAHGITLTCLEPGLIRLALPDRILCAAELSQVGRALSGVLMNRSMWKTTQCTPASLPD